MHTTSSTIIDDLKNPSTWTELIQRNPIVKEDASFDHAFGTEHRESYEIGEVHTRYMTQCFIVELDSLGSWLWFREIPKELELQWQTAPTVFGDVDFFYATINTIAWLDDVVVQLCSQKQAVITVRYAYESHVEDIKL
jgi:hypothetical protein